MRRCYTYVLCGIAVLDMYSGIDRYCHTIKRPTFVRHLVINLPQRHCHTKTGTEH
jgi:hypothetical protein